MSIDGIEAPSGTLGALALILYQLRDGTFHVSASVSGAPISAVGKTPTEAICALLARVTERARR